MRVLFVNPIGTVGGAERVLLNMLAALRRMEPTADLGLLAATEGPLLQAAASLGVEATCLPLPERLNRLGDSQLRTVGRIGNPSYSQLRKTWQVLGSGLAAVPAVWRYARELRRFIRDWRPDLIHSNGIKANFLLHLARVKGIPIVWHVHDFYTNRPLVARALGWARQRVAGAIAISEAVGRDVMALLPGLPVEVIYNTVDMRSFRPGAGDGDWLDRLGGFMPTPGPVLRVGLLATYARWKGQDVFLKAVATLAKDSPPLPVRFFVIGGPIYHTGGSQYSIDELRHLATTLGVAQQVGFVAFQADPVPVYRALDIVVHASTQPEPFGLTIAEAMACGRAVIVAQAGGAAELFQHGVEALGTPPGDSQALAGAVRRLVHDSEMRRRLGDNARRRALKLFNPERLGPQLLAAYDHFHSLIRTRTVPRWTATPRQPNRSLLEPGKGRA